MRTITALAVTAIATLYQPQLIFSYDHHEEAAYLTNFDAIASSSHSDVTSSGNNYIPTSLISSCVNQGKLQSPLVDVIVSSGSGGGGGDGVNNITTTSTSVQSECGIDTHCIVPQNVKVVMDSDLNVGALTIYGQFDWSDGPDDSSSSSQQYYLCAGYIIVTSTSSLLHIDLSSSPSSRGYIYIKNNGASPSNVEMMGTRVLGTDMGGSMIIKGYEKKRSWTLLSSNFGVGESEMKVLHDVVAMGWQVRGVFCANR